MPPHEDLYAAQLSLVIFHQLLNSLKMYIIISLELHVYVFIFSWSFINTSGIIILVFFCCCCSKHVFSTFLFSGNLCAVYCGIPGLLTLTALENTVHSCIFISTTFIMVMSSQGTRYDLYYRKYLSIEIYDGLNTEVYGFFMLYPMISLEQQNLK